MKERKLLGIELCRGLSTYAVILVHSGDETWGLPIDLGAIAFRLNFYFAVPFFLATAFYFMTSKPEIAYSSRFWKSRFERLLIPYAIWSSIFLISRVVFFTLSKKTDRWEQLLQDPLSITFLGGASYHLYFLPLLFAGTFLVLLIPYIEKIKVRKLGLILLSILSIILYNTLEISGNSFQLGANFAFQSFLNFESINIELHPLLRLFLVEVAWIIRCLPYFFIALTLNRLLQNQNTKTQYSLSSFLGISFVILFVIFDLLGNFLPQALKEILLGFALLLLSIFLSGNFSNNIRSKITLSMGMCSFGVYLIHPFVMIFTKSIIGKFLPGITDSVSIFSMLALSVPTFVISWILVACFVRNKTIAKYLFGI
jgi:peptidoglycan/LPS O-acetylase OafA/YrhL